MHGLIEQTSDIVLFLTSNYLMSPPAPPYGIEMEVGHISCFLMVVQFVDQQVAIIVLKLDAQKS
jgi:hypothetical protein